MAFYTLYMDIYVYQFMQDDATQHMQLRPNAPVSTTPSLSFCFPSYFEPIARHTTLVLLNRALTVFLRVVTLREQHAVVSAGFLVFADTAWLYVHKEMVNTWKNVAKPRGERVCEMYLDFGSALIGRLVEVRRWRRS